MYKCSICNTEVTIDDINNPPIRPCGHTEGTIYAEMTANVTATNFGKYNQLLDFGIDFGKASLLLKSHDNNSHLYLYLACHSIENLFKYLLCKEGILTHQTLKTFSKNGHDIVELGTLVKKTNFKDLITPGLEVELFALNLLFIKAHLAYGNIETQFTVASDFISSEIFLCISKLINMAREGSI